MADLETYLKAIANGETAELPEPTSALGVYLKAIIDGNTDVPQPTSVLGAYLYEIAKNGLGGGGGGGGGGDTGGVKTATGTITVAEQMYASKTTTITHNLGVVPKGFVAILSSVISGSQFSSGRLFLTSLVSEKVYTCSYYENSQIKALDQTSGGYLENINQAMPTETEINIFFSSSYAVSTQIPAGATIRWFVWG